jgi:hypothetical protein
MAAERSPTIEVPPKTDVNPDVGLAVSYVRIGSDVLRAYRASPTPSLRLTDSKKFWARGPRRWGLRGLR